MQKGEFKTEVTIKQNTPNFPKNEHLLPPDTHVYVFFCLITDDSVSGIKDCSFLISK